MLLNDSEKGIFRFIKHLPRRYKAAFWLGMAVFAAKYAADFLQPQALRAWIDSAVAAGTPVVPWALGVVLAFTASSFLTLTHYAVFRKTRVSLGKYLYKECLVRIARLPRAEIQRHGTGHFTSILVNLTQSLGTLVSPTIFEFFLSSAFAVGAFIVLATWDLAFVWVFGIAFALSAFNTAVFQRERVKKLEAFNRGQTSISAATSDVVANAFSLKSGNTLMRFLDPLWHDLDANRADLSSFLRSLELNRFAFAIVKGTALVAATWIAIGRIASGRLSYGQLLALFAYFETLFAPFHAYVTFLGDLTNYGGWVRRYEEFSQGTQHSETELDFTMRRITDVSVEEASAGFGTGKIDLVLNGRTGLVGLSGEGKTSALRMLYGEGAAREGRVTVGGRDVCTFPPLYWYRALNILTQDVDVFNRDLTANVALGREVVDDLNIPVILDNLKHEIAQSRLMTRKRLEDFPERLRPLLFEAGICDEHGAISRERLARFWAAWTDDSVLAEVALNLVSVRRSDYERVIDALGLRKLEGRPLGERGGAISGGERQRIAFARFLLKRDWDFFVLDEPFTGLDALTLSTAMNLIETAIKGKIGAVISHDFRVLDRLCTDYAVIQNGSVVERGIQKELERLGGVYATLRTKYYDDLETARDGTAEPITDTL